jgi:hypothetical protein
MTAKVPWIQFLTLSACEPARCSLDADRNVVESGAERVAHLPKLFHIIEHAGGGLLPHSRQERCASQLLHVLLVSSNVSQHGLDLREQIEAVNLHGLGVLVVQRVRAGRVRHDAVSVHRSRHSSKLKILPRIIA